MKSLMFLLLFNPFLCRAEHFSATVTRYSYKDVKAIQSGADNFRLGEYARVEKNGSILISTGKLWIDDRFFELRSTDERHIYKTRGGKVKLIYKGGMLTTVQLFQYDKVYHFTIFPSDHIASK